MSIRAAVVFVALLACAVPAKAQPAGTEPLGEIARKAEAERATAKKASKSYTNRDLVIDPTSDRTPNGSVSARSGKVLAADEMVEASQEKTQGDEVAVQSEADWSRRAESIRVQVEKLRTLKTALSQPNPARDANPGAKARQATELKNVDDGLQGLLKQWERLEKAADGARIPNWWIEPRPEFPE